MASDGGETDPADLNQTFLAGDTISYSCASPLFAIQNGPTETTCQNTGIFTVTTIEMCIKVCKLRNANAFVQNV